MCQLSAVSFTDTVELWCAGGGQPGQGGRAGRGGQVQGEEHVGIRHRLLQLRRHRGHGRAGGLWLVAWPASAHPWLVEQDSVVELVRTNADTRQQARRQFFAVNWRRFRWRSQLKILTTDILEMSEEMGSVKGGASGGTFLGAAIITITSVQDGEFWPMFPGLCCNSYWLNMCKVKYLSK